MEIEEAKRRARSGPRLLLARRAFALILTFVSTVTVARLVSPVEYGLANMALVVLGFAQIFRDFGLTNAVMRKGVISQEEMSFIFWFNAATTVALALVMAALSPLAARFYHEPIVESVILVSLLGFVLSGLSSQHRALMTRDLRFGAIAAIDTVGMVAGFITTLTLAALYHNVWSIVFGMFAQALVGAVVNVWLSGWHPGPPKRIDDLSSLLKFAANSSVFSISVFLSNSAAPVLIGHFLGAGPLGQFNRADTLFRLPMVNLIQPITQATMPLLTRLRAVPEEYRIAYIGLVRKLCTVLFPASVILTFVSISLVQALLGSRWEVAGHVLTALAPTLVAIAVASAASDLFVTQDRAAELRSLGLGETVLRVGAIVVAVRYGVVAAALTFTVTTMIAAVVRVVVAGRKGPVTTGDQLKATLPSIPIAIGSGAACFAAQLFSHAYLSTSTETAAMILTSGMAGGLVLAVCLRSSRAAVTEILEIFGIGRLVRKRKHSA